MRSIPLKRLCTTISRGSASSYSDNEHGDAQAIGQSCQRPDGSFDRSRTRWHEGPTPAKGRVFGGEIVINSTGTGTLGRLAALPDLSGPVPVFADSHVTVLRTDPAQADGRYVAYLLGLPSFRQLAEEALSVGATKQRELNVEALRAHSVNVLSKSEQSAVADFLDRECERIRSLSTELTTYTVHLSAPALEEFRSLTQGTVRGRIGYRFEVQLGKMLDEQRVKSNDLSPYIRNANVHWDRLVLSDLKSMTFSTADRRKFALLPGDVLVCEGGEPGRAAVWKAELRDCYYQKALHRLRAYGADSPRFLLWCLWDLSSRGAFGSDGPGRYAHLTAEQLRAVRIPLPAPSEQHRIADAVDALAEKATDVSEEVEGLRLGLGEYRDALITEAVSGELDVRRLSDRQLDESAQAAIEGEQPEVLVT